MEKVSGQAGDRNAAAPVRVLLAEDDVLLAATVAEFLEEVGFRVVLGHDGAQALALADEVAFDVLLTDLRMPAIDGVTLIRSLRFRRPDLPVVVMSGNVPEGWRDGIGPTPDGRERLILLEKPMSMTRLCEALREVLGTPPATLPPRRLPGRMRAAAR